ncbi:hypothetical protein [Sinorhizobium saheli]|uniref:Uncharacterized protein n=1 Tax=Sinorhizobium saheli TaxID=36856 RepID=A0A178YG97_SINSA|nr:hypothetical protein [Sinorhizobium saheli]MQW86848.1 hypothetical protein [Sinorhizobium saheli]OAP46538.1 hypothetical protein ATB98_14285 [Sinorhizobium saheli]
MQGYKAAYIAVVFIAGFGSIGMNFVYPENELLIMAISHWILAVLTFPIGVFASAIGFVLLYMGLSTPAEITLVTTPIFAALGYAQWFRLGPRIYRSRRARDLVQ